jgi:tellurite resistance protein
MHANYSIDDILSPLALTVIIDNIVRDPEMNEFVEQAHGLLEMLGYGDQMNRQKIKAWFHHEESRLNAEIKGKKKNTIILKALTRFKDDDAVIEAMYDAMLAISISDKEYHASESDLVKSAASLWGYTRPPFKVMGRK